MIQNYVRHGGFGWSLGDFSDCTGDEHYDPQTDRCFTCDPGWVFDPNGNTCIKDTSGSTSSPTTTGGHPGSYATQPYGPVGPPPGSPPVSAQAASAITTAAPWVLGGAIALGLLWAAARPKKAKK